VRAENQAAREQFDKQHGDSTQASIGRVIGQTVATAPVIGGVGGLVARGAGATGLPGVQTAIDVLSGTKAASPGAGVVERALTRGGSLAAEGAGQGAATGALTAAPDQSTGDAALTGALQGAVLGPAIRAATAGVGYGARALTGNLPNMVDPTTATLADKLRTRYGIDLDPAQLTDNPTYKLIADQLGKLPFSGAGQRVAQARLQWQQAVAREMGESAPQGVTHDVMDTAATRIGKAFDDVANRTTIQGGAPLQDDLVTIAQDMPKWGLTADQKTPIQAQFQNVLQAFKDGNGQITGQAYQNLTRRGGPLDDVINSNDPTVSSFAMRIKNAVDEAFQRSASPADQAALQQARYQYRVMKTIEPLVEMKGASGDINPNGLLQRVRAQSAKYDPSTGGLAYTGGGPLGDLAYGGQRFFGPAPDSGTAARNWVMAGLLGGGAASAIAHPLVPAGTALGLAANRALQYGIRNPQVGANMVANTLSPRIAPPSGLGPYTVPGAVSAYQGLLGY
jgi:hypothetical protein